MHQQEQASMSNIKEIFVCEMEKHIELGENGMYVKIEDRRSSMLVESFCPISTGHQYTPDNLINRFHFQSKQVLSFNYYHCILLALTSSSILQDILLALSLSCTGYFLF